MINREALIRKILWTSGALIGVIFAFVSVVVLLNPSSVGNRNFLWNLSLWAVVWALIFILTLVLTVTLARYLIHLFFEFQSSRAGSRIRRKLVLTFVIFSLFPSLIMAFLAFGLINQNLIRWASAPSEQLLVSSHNVAEAYYEQLGRSLRSSGRFLADRWARSLPDPAVLLAEARSVGFEGVLVLDGERTVVQAGTTSDLATPEELAGVRSGELVFRLLKTVNLRPGMADLGMLGLPLSRFDELGQPDRRGLFLFFRIPESVAFHVSGVEEANQVYEGLRGTLEGLRLTYFLVLAMTTLAVVFGFVWLGNYIARRLTGPLEALAEGSRQLAEGNLDHRVDVRGVDELAILVDAFNRMAGQLRANREELESANQELRWSNASLEERGRYIETILQNIATGVVTIDEGGTIRTANNSALMMLQSTAPRVIGRNLEEVTDRELYQEFLSMKQRARLYGTYRTQLSIRRGDSNLIVAATMTTNPSVAGPGIEYLVVLDDLTELIRAEKFTAWQQVARRLAHEIKNPLTPILLSSERIKRRFEKIASRLPRSAEVEAFCKVLEDGTRMIASESKTLRNLLSEFAEFARLPICRPTEVDLHSLINSTLHRYDGSLDLVQVVRDFDPAMQKITGDPEQLQRVFTNLIDNSLDALVDERNREIVIRTRLNGSRQSVTVEFADNGHGIPAEVQEHLFLPYFSTKRKGTGLGLAIVRQIISEHQGFIRAEPNEPKGARIVFEIPLIWKTAHESQAADR